MFMICFQTGCLQIKSYLLGKWFSRDWWCHWRRNWCLWRWRNQFLVMTVPGVVMTRLKRVKAWESKYVARKHENLSKKLSKWLILPRQPKVTHFESDSMLPFTWQIGYPSTFSSYNLDSERKLMDFKCYDLIWKEHNRKQ